MIDFFKLFFCWVVILTMIVLLFYSFRLIYEETERESNIENYKKIQKTLAFVKQECKNCEWKND
jgi:hypothetical protein